MMLDEVHKWVASIESRRGEGLTAFGTSLSGTALRVVNLWLKMRKIGERGGRNEFAYFLRTIFLVKR